HLLLGDLLLEVALDVAPADLAARAQLLQHPLAGRALLRFGLLRRGRASGLRSERAGRARLLPTGPVSGPLAASHWRGVVGRGLRLRRARAGLLRAPRSLLVGVSASGIDLPPGRLRAVRAASVRGVREDPRDGLRVDRPRLAGA